MERPQFSRREDYGDVLPGELNGGAEHASEVSGNKNKKDAKKKRTGELLLHGSLIHLSSESGEDRVIFRQPKKEESKEEQPVVPEEDGEPSTEASETLSEVEEAQVFQTYVEMRADTLATQAEAGLPASEEAAVTANREFLLQIEEAIEQQAQAESMRVDVEAAIDQVYQETVAQFDPSDARAEDPSALRTSLAETASPGMAAETESEDVPQEDSQTTHTARFAAAAGGAPPHRYGGGGAGVHNANAYAGMGGHAYQNMAPQTQGNPQGETVQRHEAPNLAPAFLALVIGNIIGRRQGAKKVERKLLPEKKKLEEQVQKLVANVAVKEEHIRRLAREQARSMPLTVVSAERPQRASSEGSHEPPREAPPLRMPETRVPTPSVAHAPEHNRSSYVAASESVPHAQAPARPRAEAIARPAKAAESMSHEELLSASAAIMVGTENLKAYYDDHRLNEEGLRQIVQEHQRSGDIRSVLTNELMKHDFELHFERLDTDAQEAQEKENRSREVVRSVQGSPLILPPWAQPEQAPPVQLSPERQMSDSVLHTTVSSQRISTGNQRTTLQPVLVAANVAAFIVLGILVTVLLIIYF